jgi:hypothetical protein
LRKKFCFEFIGPMWDNICASSPMATQRAFAALAVATACVILAVAVVLDRTPAVTPSSLELIKDLDAPNNLDRAILVVLIASWQSCRYEGHCSSNQCDASASL